MTTEENVGDDSCPDREQRAGISFMYACGSGLSEEWMSFTLWNMSKGESRVENGWVLHAKVDDDDIAAGMVGAVEDVLR